MDGYLREVSRSVRVSEGGLTSGRRRVKGDMERTVGHNTKRDKISNRL